MITSVFTNNRSQAVRLPAIFRFPKETQKVFVRVVGVERVICPVEHIWDSFDDAQLTVSDDFERGEQIAAERESFDVEIYVRYQYRDLYHQNKPPEVKVRFNAVATQLCVSSITVAELIYGAENSQNPIKNLRVVEDFLSRLQILDYTLKQQLNMA